MKSRWTLVPHKVVCYHLHCLPSTHWIAAVTVRGYYKQSFQMTCPCWEWSPKVFSSEHLQDCDTEISRMVWQEPFASEYLQDLGISNRLPEECLFIHPSSDQRAPSRNCPLVQVPENHSQRQAWLDWELNNTTQEKESMFVSPKDDQVVPHEAWSSEDILPSNGRIHHPVQQLVLLQQLEDRCCCQTASSGETAAGWLAQRWLTVTHTMHQRPSGGYGLSWLMKLIFWMMNSRPRLQPEKCQIGCYSCWKQGLVDTISPFFPQPSDCTMISLVCETTYCCFLLELLGFTAATTTAAAALCACVCVWGGGGVGGWGECVYVCVCGGGGGITTDFRLIATVFQSKSLFWYNLNLWSWACFMPIL